MICTAYCHSPLGILKIISTDRFIMSVDFCEDLSCEITVYLSPLAQACIQQLTQYFSHQRQLFDLPLQLPGTTFQKQAWQALQTIPYGQTISYQQQAISIGREKAVRAIGLANSKNPIAIIIPCHRVIGKNGKLTGYAGKVWRKEWLLKHEKIF